MLLFVAILKKLSASQTPIIRVTYNFKSYSFYYSELNVKNIMLAFNITSLDCLEDSSGNPFYPFMGGTFPPFISSDHFLSNLPLIKNEINFKTM